MAEGARHEWQTRTRDNRRAHLAYWPGKRSYLLAITDDDMHLKVTVELELSELMTLREYINTEARRRVAEARK